MRAGEYHALMTFWLGLMILGAAVILATN